MALRQNVHDENAERRQFEEAVNLAMRHTGVNYSEALELVLTPSSLDGGGCVAEYLRLGQVTQARKVLAELIEDRQHSLRSEKSLKLTSRGYRSA
jgi:hypothetical protein